MNIEYKKDTIKDNVFYIEYTQGNERMTKTHER